MGKADNSMQSTASDEQLVRAVLSGSHESYRHLVLRYEKPLMAFLLKRIHERSDALDVLQETFIAVYKNLPTFDPSKVFSAWIYGVARNKANNHFRSLKSAPDDTQEQAQSDNVTPLTGIDLEEQAKVFWDEAKRLLNEDQHTALWLRYQSDLSVKDIAESMDQSLSNVKILLFRARKVLSQSSLLAEQHQLAAAVNY